MATFSNLADDTAETITLGFTGDGLTSPASVPIVVSPAAASKLVFKTEPPATATAGIPFATPTEIEELDQFGNLETSDSSTMITVSLASGTGPIQGTSTVTVSGGVATFANLSDDTAGTIKLQIHRRGSKLARQRADPDQPGSGERPTYPHTTILNRDGPPVIGDTASNLRDRQIRQSGNGRRHDLDHGVAGDGHRPAPGNRVGHA